jgi:hypothetical protein
MANAGRYGVGIGTGAASGAMAGASFGPWGAVIGGGLGAIGGGLSTLLSSSDEAKQRRKALEAYRQQTREQREQYEQQRLEASQNDWDRRFASLTGADKLPGYAGFSYEPYKVEPFPSLAAEEEAFNAHMPIEPAPNYGALAQSAMSLGSTVGGLARQDAAQQKLDELIQSRKNQYWAQQGLPWGGYSSGGGSFY